MMASETSFFGVEFFLREGEDEEGKVRMDSDSFDEISDSSSSPPVESQPLVMRYDRTPIPIYRDDGDFPYRTIEVTSRVAKALNMDLPEIKNLAVPVSQEKARKRFVNKSKD